MIENKKNTEVPQQLLTVNSLITKVMQVSVFYRYVDTMRRSGYKARPPFCIFLQKMGQPQLPESGGWVDLLPSYKTKPLLNVIQQGEGDKCFECCGFRRVLSFVVLFCLVPGIELATLCLPGWHLRLNSQPSQFCFVSNFYFLLVCAHNV